MLDLFHGSGSMWEVQVSYNFNPKSDQLEITIATRKEMSIIKENDQQ